VAHDTARLGSRPAGLYERFDKPPPPAPGFGRSLSEQVALYVRFKSDQGESFWNDLIKRAGLADRRKDNVVPIAERRRRTGSRG